MNLHCKVAKGAINRLAMSNSRPHPCPHDVSLCVPVQLPTCLQCGMGKFLEASELWMSSGGTASLLHTHADHSLHCVLAGRKDFILVHAQHKDKLAFHADVSVHTTD